MTETVIINDVGPRDGLQNDPADVTPEDRALLINRLIDAGVPAVEVASFVSPRAVPR
jgi:hydroxymethylglutaryl-CoA lyase